LIHPYAGVLSAYGIGLADVHAIKEQGIEMELSEKNLQQVNLVFDKLVRMAEEEVKRQNVADKDISTIKKVHIRYEETDKPLIVDYGSLSAMETAFKQQHKKRFGFVEDLKLIIEAVSVEGVGKSVAIDEMIQKDLRDGPLKPVDTTEMYSQGGFTKTPIYQRDHLNARDQIKGPAIIIETNATTVVEPGWRADVTEKNHLILKRFEKRIVDKAIGTDVDPVRLEIFNNLYMSIAEQMGVTLKNTTQSVNIKERLDFSCAIFDHKGGLVANAPHIPVHLGSMSDSVRSIVKARGSSMKPGDVFALNAPYNGGTHLPDVTIITPVFDDAGHSIIFFVASRGHHADIGGMSPGSMPPFSKTIEEEGVLIDDFQIVKQGNYCEKETWDLLTKNKYPARSPKRNISDFKAQIAANEKGVQEIRNMIEEFSLKTVQAYMQHVQNNAEESVRRVIDRLKDGKFSVSLDNGAKISVSIKVDSKNRSAVIDFSGTSAQLDNNFNAPTSVCRAAVLYVFRTLVDDDIPLNEGCLKPIELKIPEDCFLSPKYPAAVVAGNVETSQHITDCLYGALGVLSASQGTMNNFTFGTDKYQYYETVAGGSGAGPDYDGTDAVQTHMTNSRLTDPEVLEWRFPVHVQDFKIRDNSGGVGQYKGGNGVVRRIKFLEPMTASILSSHRLVQPFGLHGGGDGQVGRNYVEKKDGSIVELKGCDQLEVDAGDVFIIETPGGGGWGRLGD